jgi:kynurenine formamidase
MPAQVDPSWSPLDELAAQVSNWGRWGSADELGTVNLITPQSRVRAARLVSSGEVVSLCQPLPLGGQAGPPNSVHVVWRSFDPVQAAAEFIGLDFHGPAVTHLDAICHIHRDGQMYNGWPASDVRPRQGAGSLGVQALAERIAGRGVLLDVAAAKEVSAIAAGSEVTARDLDLAQEFGQVKVGPGDLVFVRMGGRAVVGSDDSGWRMADRLPGLAPACLPWFHARDIAVLGTDVAADGIPQESGRWAFPVHQLAIFFMGLPLLDNCELEALSAACARHRRYEFFSAVAPLPIIGGTGGPVSPLAFF